MMKYEEYFLNHKYNSGIAEQFNTSNAMLGTFQSALSQISAVPKYKEMLDTAEVDRMGVVGTMSQKILDSINRVTPLQTAVVGVAITDGFTFEKGVEKVLRSAYSPVLKTINKAEKNQSSISSFLVTGFVDRIKPTIYLGGIRSQTLIDKTWLRNANPWRTSVSELVRINTEVVKNIDTPFSKLVRMEKVTGELLGKKGTDVQVTSVATQLASIYQAKNEISVLTAPVRLLTTYNDFAINQNREIQKAVKEGKTRDAAWRLGLLDVTSKFVDRQVIQGFEITAALDGLEIIDNGCDDYEITESEELQKTDAWREYEFPLSLIPQEIGYSKREDSTVTLEEALDRSDTATITELGFGIVNRVLEVNKLQKDLFRDCVFKPTEKTMRIIGKLGQFICDSEEKFLILINGLYFLIYENQTGIKKMLGSGDQNVGDQIIREKECECIFRIKDIRTDFEHDIEHGDAGNQRKKKKDIEDAYKYYAKKRPAKAKEYKQFQIKLYEDVILLIDYYIQHIRHEEEAG